MTYHLMFYEFLPSYIDWMHHGEPISHQSPSSILYTRSRIDTKTDASYLGNIDTEGLLNDIFGLNKQGCI